MIIEVIKLWPIEWHVAFDEAAKTRKSTKKKKKETAR